MEGNRSPEGVHPDSHRQHSDVIAENYGANQLYKVACGPSADDYNWMKVITENIKPWHTNAVSLHDYTVPTGKWEGEGQRYRIYRRGILHNA